MRWLTGLQCAPGNPLSLSAYCVEGRLEAGLSGQHGTFTAAEWQCQLPPLRVTFSVPSQIRPAPVLPD